MCHALGDNHNGWWVGSDAKCGMDEGNPVKVAEHSII